jgi:hypothetical protein
MKFHLASKKCTNNHTHTKKKGEEFPLLSLFLLILIVKKLQKLLISCSKSVLEET